MRRAAAPCYLAGRRSVAPVESPLLIGLKLIVLTEYVTATARARERRRERRPVLARRALTVVGDKKARARTPRRSGGTTRGGRRTCGGRRCAGRSRGAGAPGRPPSSVGNPRAGTAPAPGCADRSRPWRPRSPASPPAARGRSRPSDRSPSARPPRRGAVRVAWPPAARAADARRATPRPAAG